MKKIILVMDGNFSEYKNNIYSPHMGFSRFGKRFSSIANPKTLLARSFKKEKAIGEVVTGENFSFKSISNNRGAISFVSSIPKIIKNLSAYLKSENVIIIRFPGNIAILALLLCKIKKLDYHINIVADPAEYFSSKAYKGKLRVIAKYIHVFFTKYAARDARSAHYVTQKYLQRHYPPGKQTREFAFSDVALVDKFRDSYKPQLARIELLSVAMMHNDSKGHLDMIQLIKALVDENIDVKLTLVGDGSRKADYVAVSERLGVSSRVEFSGLLNSEEIFIQMQKSSIFVLFSYQEGMPRALLEAIHFGMPVVATNVGGVAEVVDAQYLFEPGDIHQAKKIITEIFNGDSLNLASKNSLSNSTAFQESSISKQYQIYLGYLQSV